ncbi:MAG: shikimate dehydrogenase [Kofleriaceae bacterium]
MIRGTTRIAAVIGWPVEHSRSPAILNAAFTATHTDAVLVPVNVAPESFRTVIAGLGAMRAIGASVTLPHKLAAAAACDDLSPAALEIGSVNCLHFVDGEIHGHNTDADGFVDGLRAAGHTPKHATLLGAGGAARAVAHGLRSLGCETEVIARRPDAVTWTAARAWTADELRAAFTRSDLIVDATPIGLGGADEFSLVEELPLEALGSGGIVATLVYHRPTLLAERARGRGHSILDGRAMLVHQAARAFAIWTGQVAPIDVMLRALDDSLAGT